MTTSATVPPLTGTLSVELPIDVAFRFFTESFNAWWPPQYHIGQVDMAEAILEGRVGGRWYERGVDGSECDWGQVRVWEPPNRLVVTWQINGYWQYDPDPEHASEVEIRFTAQGDTHTLVDVVHDQLDRLVGAKELRDGITGGGGWSSLLEAFAATATAANRH
ncbi:MAG TPA: SRPBCC family protein [Acidimicrobiales bacterium]|jgi:uncharacterized protein YndB with AHSA1/START domain|nr:SRPBCC family protein [Acidimicrobiales bacterium]